jgi:hypothetical protein
VNVVQINVGESESENHLICWPRFHWLWRCGHWSIDGSAFLRFCRIPFCLVKYGIYVYMCRIPFCLVKYGIYVTTKKKKKYGIYVYMYQEEAVDGRGAELTEQRLSVLSLIIFSLANIFSWELYYTI